MVEQVKYKLVKSLNDVEIRFYDKLVIAKIEGYGDGGFNILFNYISGNNVKNAKLDMTTPVLSQKIEMTAPVLSEKGTIAFVLPKKYTLENAPKPNDERVKIQQIHQRHIAALRFSGRWTTSNFDNKSKQLIKELRKVKIKTKGNIFSMRYSGPLTPWFMHRNEVAIEVELK